MRTLTLSLAALLFSAPALSGCATALDPAEVCTPSWIAPRADRAVDAIEKDTSRVMRSLRSAGESFMAGKTPGPLKMLSLSRSVKGLERELTDGRGVRDLRTLARTCDDPVILSDAMGLWLDRQGLPDGLQDFIARSDMFERLLELGDDVG